jgi:hypothetical protein
VPPHKHGPAGLTKLVPILIWAAHAGEAVSPEHNVSPGANFMNLHRLQDVFLGCCGVGCCGVRCVPMDPCASPPPRPSIFVIILFGSTTLLTGMTGISLHLQWPLTFQTHGSVSQREQ